MSPLTFERQLTPVQWSPQLVFPVPFQALASVRQHRQLADGALFFLAGTEGTVRMDAALLQSVPPTPNLGI